MIPNPRSRQFDPRIRGGFSMLGMIVVAIAAMAAIAVAPLDGRVKEQLAFPAAHMTIIDADTVAFGSIRIRLKGVAAPERGHREYDAGLQFLRNLLPLSKSARCDLTGERTYGRRVGRCYLIDAEGMQTDMQSAVIRAGYARSCVRYGGWRYLLDETSKSRSLPFPSYCIGFSIW